MAKRIPSREERWEKIRRKSAAGNEEILVVVWRYAACQSALWNIAAIYVYRRRVDYRFAGRYLISAAGHRRYATNETSYASLAGFRWSPHRIIAPYPRLSIWYQYSQ